MIIFYWLYMNDVKLTFLYDHYIVLLILQKKETACLKSGVGN